MAIHWYLLPFDSATSSPKHLEPPENGDRWDSKRYFHGDAASYVALVKADISDVRHALIAADVECVVLPDPDTTVLPGQLTVIQNVLEARHIPSGWVAAGMTFRQVYRRVALMGILWMRFRGRTLGANVFGGGVTLETAVASLPVNVRQSLADIADEFQIDRAGVVTVRDALAAWYQSPVIQAMPIMILGESL